MATFARYRLVPTPAVAFLVKEKGLTLDGTAKQLDADRASVDKRVRALESLKSIRGQLAEIRKSL